VHAALYVQAAVRGFLARYEMREQLKNVKKSQSKLSIFGS
jgi:hypothetical protein